MCICKVAMATATGAAAMLGARHTADSRRGGEAPRSRGATGQRGIGHHVSSWRVTVQANRSNRAHCRRCKQSFAVGVVRLMSACGHCDNYFHIHCVDVALRCANDFADYGTLPPAGATKLIDALVQRGQAGSQQSQTSPASSLATPIQNAMSDTAPAASVAPPAPLATSTTLPVPSPPAPDPVQHHIPLEPSP